MYTCYSPPPSIVSPPFLPCTSPPYLTFSLPRPIPSSVSPPQLWASISALRSFSPGSGIHEWALRIDKSDRGHVFVGIVTSDASMESYIGSDR